MFADAGINRLSRAVLIPLVLLLASTSHRISPATTVRSVRDGKAPLPSRRIQPGVDNLARKMISDDPNADPQPLVKSRMLGLPSDQELFPALRNDSARLLSREIRKPDYLKLFLSSNPCRSLPPPL
jgi:hypothetical protein